GGVRETGVVQRARQPGRGGAHGDGEGLVVDLALVLEGDRVRVLLFRVRGDRFEPPGDPRGGGERGPDLLRRAAVAETVGEPSCRGIGDSFDGHGLGRLGHGCSLTTGSVLSGRPLGPSGAAGSQSIRRADSDGVKKYPPPSGTVKCPGTGTRTSRTGPSSGEGERKTNSRRRPPAAGRFDRPTIGSGLSPPCCWYGLLSQERTMNSNWRSIEVW